jgi:hypothetical protein
MREAADGVLADRGAVHPASSSLSPTWPPAASRLILVLVVVLPMGGVPVAVVQVVQVVAVLDRLVTAIRPVPVLVVALVVLPMLRSLVRHARLLTRPPGGNSRATA